MDSDSDTASLAGARTLGRAVDLLRLIASHGVHGARLLDLASGSSFSRPTVHRLLKRLCAERLTAQDPHSKRYVLGSLAFELGLAARSPLRRLSQLRPEIDKLAATTEDTVYLLMRTGDELVCLYVAEGAYPVRVRFFDVGVRQPLGTGGGGLAMLAAMKEEDARAIVQRHPEWVDRLGGGEQLLKRVAVARLHGAVSRGATHDGVTGVAVTVPVQVGAPYLAVSVGAVTSRMPDARVARLWPSLHRTAKRIAAIEASAV